MRDAGARVTLFEQQAEPGGVWVYDPEPEANPLGDAPPAERKHGALYASLNTNLPRDLMAFECFTFDSAGGGDDAWARYPHHSQVQTYLARFANHFGLTPHIRYSTEVTRLTPTADRRWLVSAGGTEQIYDQAIVCNGHYTRPRVPALKGAANFTGQRLHSKNYREPAPFAGLRVALWGAAASGVDISREIATVAAATYWCGDRFEDRMPPVVPEPGKVHTSRSPDRFMDPNALAFGKQRVEIDVFVYCTGYHYSHDFLDPAIVSIDDNHVGPLYRDIVSPAYPTLGFIGLPYLVIPFPLCEVQARYLAAMWFGAAALPAESQMLEWCASRDADNQRAGVRLRHYHRLAEAQFDYMAELLAEAGLPALPAWRQALADATNRLRTERPDVFRSVDLPHLAPTVVSSRQP